MSFGWSAGDIVAAIDTFITIGKALKESGGSKSEYQASVQFLESVHKTLKGIQLIVEKNPNLPCEANLVEQVDIVRSAVGIFEQKIAKYKPSLGGDSTRGRVRTIPREIQLALSSSVKELQRDISQPQLVLNVFIGLQTLSSTLEISKTSKLSLEGLQKLTEDVSQLLPTIADGVKTLDSDVKLQLGGLETKQEQSELNLRDDLRNLHRHLTDVKDLQTAMIEESKADSWTRLRWQKELQLSVQGLVDCTKATHVDLLLKMEAEKRQDMSVTSGKDSLAAKIPAAVGQVFQFVGNGLAAAIGTVVIGALTAQISSGDGKQRGWTNTTPPKGRDQPAFYQLFDSGATLPVWDDRR